MESCKKTRCFGSPPRPGARYITRSLEPEPGGLLLSQVLTLYTTPVIYLYLDALQARLTGRRKRRMPRLARGMRHKEVQPAAE